MRRSYILGYGSVGLLLLLGLLLVNPSTADDSLAESCLDNPTGNECYSTMAEAEVGVTANTAISLAVDASVNMEVTPTSTGATSSASKKLNISTNSNDGYALYMQAGSSTGDLVNTASMISNVIKNSTKQDVTLANLEKNSYGYALTQDIADAGTTYSGIPTTGSIIQKTTSVTETEGNFLYGDTYYLSFGVNIGTDIQAGSYTGSVMISAVANPKTLATMFDLNYMQEMTSEICTNTREGYTKRLTDNRDGKQYWVAKLKDGNCWMTQNLALDLSTSKALTPEDSDVKSSWVPPQNTSTAIPSGMVSPPNTEAQSWNLGNYVYAHAASNDLCKGSGSDQWNSVRPGETLSRCANFQLVDNTWTYKPAGSGIWDRSSIGLVAADKAAKTYDSHYLIGNYYQWNAATAETGKTITNTEAPSSICPKGWKLPSSGHASTGVPIDKNRSFANLFAAYGYPQPGQADGWTLPTSTGGSASVDINYPGATSVVYPPLYFVRDGYLNPGNGAVHSVGYYGFVWSATSDDISSDYAMLFILGPKTIMPSIRTNRYHGASVRCVAR